MKKKQLALRIAALTMALGVAQAVHAADGRKIEVPAGDLVSALNALASQAGVEFVYEVGQLQGLQTGGVSGELSAEEAATKLVEGTNLHVASAGNGAIAISNSSSVTTAGGAPSTGNGNPGGQDSAASPEATEEATELGRITVTGSRLRQMYDSVIPTRQLDREEVIEYGQLDLAEALREMPGVEVNDSITTNQGSFQGSGLSTIALRGLGVARTLVLIDGRRTVSNAGNRNAVSVSTIPTYMIRNVEVTTGGASAVYGSDAIAGVVNVITEDRMDGFRVRTHNRTTHGGGGNATEFSLGGGSRFFNDRLYVMGAATYENQRPLYARDRDWAMRSASYSALNNTLSSPHLSNVTDGGRFAGVAFYYDEDGLHEGFSTVDHGYEWREPGLLITPREMLNVGGKLNFDVNDNLQFYSQVMYSDIDTAVQFEPVGSQWSETFGVEDEFEVGRIPRFNPYAPAEISARVTDAGITWFRRFSELGNREFDNRRVTWRGAAGFRGDLFDGRWDWDFSYGFGDFDQNQLSTNYLNLVNVQNALDATVIDGEIVCTDPVARAEGCVPLNLFGVGTISPEAADYVRAHKEFRARNRQHTVDASIVGSPFSVPAGDVETAFGIEWRRDTTSSRTDDLTQEGVTSGPFIPNFTGQITTRAAYAEARVPLLRNRPLAHELNVEFALRLSDYPDLANVDTKYSYRAALQWAPTDRVMFRAAYGLAHRAPYTTELYSPPREGYSTIPDVCHGVTAATPGIIAENCRLDPRIAAVIAEDGQFIQSNARVLNPPSGNPDLKEESAQTFTAGFVLSPWQGMEASVDYFDIRIRDAINAISNASLMNECYSDPNGIDNQFCAPIIRNAEGQIIRVDSQSLNMDLMRASGIDVAFNQRFSLHFVPGQFTLRGSYAHRLRRSTTFPGATGTAVTDFNNQIGTFRNEARTVLGWSNRPNWPVGIAWTTIYRGAAVDSNARRDLFESAGIDDPLFLHVPSFTHHNLNINIRPRRTGNTSWRVFGNILNVFDRQGPFLPEGTASGRRYNYHPTYGVTGRTYTLGAEVQF